MAQYAFGAGNAYVTPLTDAWGNSIANPTPIPLMVLQEGSIDISSDTKELFGQNQFAAAIGSAKKKIGIKVKPARIFAAAWNALFFGLTLADGVFAVWTETVGKAIPATPFTITVSSGTESAIVTKIPGTTGVFVADMGVIDATGTPMKRVASAPTAGQYTCTAGVYVFNTADASKVVFINYQYTSTSTTAKTINVTNLPMGYVPTFSYDMTVSYMGKLTTFSFPACVPGKMSIGFKNEDFAIPEFNASPYDNGTGVVMKIGLSE